MPHEQPITSEYISPDWKHKVLACKAASSRFGAPWGIALARERKNASRLSEKLLNARKDHKATSSILSRLKASRSRLIELEGV